MVTVSGEGQQETWPCQGHGGELGSVLARGDEVFLHCREAVCP